MTKYSVVLLTHYSDAIQLFCLPCWVEIANKNDKQIFNFYYFHCGFILMNEIKRHAKVAGGHYEIQICECTISCWCYGTARTHKILHNYIYEYMAFVIFISYVYCVCCMSYEWWMCDSTNKFFVGIRFYLFLYEKSAFSFVTCSVFGWQRIDNEMDWKTRTKFLFFFAWLITAFLCGFFIFSLKPQSILRCSLSPNGPNILQDVSECWRKANETRHFNVLNDYVRWGIDARVFLFDSTVDLIKTAKMSNDS